MLQSMSKHTVSIIRVLLSILCIEYTWVFVILEQYGYASIYPYACSYIILQLVEQYVLRMNIRILLQSTRRVHVCIPDLLLHARVCIRVVYEYQYAQYELVHHVRAYLCKLSIISKLRASMHCQSIRARNTTLVLATLEYPYLVICII